MAQIDIPPKVTVVTVCFNAVDNIEETIISVINQTYSNIEYIVIDGGSNDGTLEIIKKYRNKIAYFVSEPDDGIYDAMNKGIKVATGEWINFMNAGDFFYTEDTVEKMFANIPKNEAFTVVYGDVCKKEKIGRKIEKAHSMSFIKRAMPFCHQSAFVSKKLNFTFDTTYRICADYNLFYHLYHCQPSQFGYVPLPISVFDNTGGLSVTHQCEHRRENLQIRSAHKDLRWFWDLIKYNIKYNILKMEG